MKSPSFRTQPLVAALVCAAALTACHSTPPKSAPEGADSVAVGYGTQARRDVTGSISSVDGDVARTHGTATSMADLLEGRVPGLEVRKLSSGGISIRIRGSRSLKSSDEPLYVVDGLPLQGGNQGAFPDLNPLDIKSIEVLKDAGSLAAYGSRGANGVILITTRRGR